jgi:hypothetical protein
MQRQENLAKTIVPQASMHLITLIRWENTTVRGTMVSSIGASKGARTEEEDIIPGKCVEKYHEGSRYQAGTLWFL